jgi:metal-responsive CopG/Arc/MetJ family transcriptional regulator
MEGMKIVVKTPEGAQLRTVTLRLPEAVMGEIDRLAEDSGVSRQRLIAEILKKAVGDKAFTVEIAVDRVKGDEE